MLDRQVGVERCDQRDVARIGVREHLVGDDADADAAFCRLQALEGDESADFVVGPDEGLQIDGSGGRADRRHTRQQRVPADIEQGDMVLTVRNRPNERSDFPSAAGRGHQQRDKNEHLAT
jgi:hypothetical protein